MKDKMLGVMIDCSRNAVMNVGALKKYIALLSKMGYDTVMLYTEDTYEVDGEPLFGYLRGRYSKAELKEIDAFCQGLGIELIPCIQTLAHLNCAFLWNEYRQIRDCDDILLIDDDRTYRLIDNMFSTIAQCFTSRRIHIGMDEAHMVGLGKYLDEHGYCDRFDLLERHLSRVCDIAAQYGFEPMMWSDMFFRLANKGNYYDIGSDFDASVAEKIPANLSLVYWDYYHDDEQVYTDMIFRHKKLSGKVIFAGGAWCWSGFAPDNTSSIVRTRSALSACRKEGVDQVFITTWGDDGAECSRFSVLPTLLYAAEVYNGNCDMDSIKAKFREIVGADFDSFLLLDAPCRLEGIPTPGISKALLYNDFFCGVNDYLCNAEMDDHFAELAKKLAAATGKGDYAYLFDTLAALCDALAVKCNLGAELRAAYKADDKEALNGLTGKMSAFEQKLTVFHDTFERQWMQDSKPYGFDVQDVRLGGLLQRTKSCNTRLRKYLSGELASIPELEEEILESPHYGGHLWARNFTPSVV